MKSEVYFLNMYQDEKLLNPPVCGLFDSQYVLSEDDQMDMVSLDGEITVSIGNNPRRFKVTKRFIQVLKNELYESDNSRGFFEKCEGLDS